jgi:ABC-type transport system involved in multi-copper enzyme maturation permease subunit
LGVCNLIAAESGGGMDRESEGYALIWISLIVTAIWLALEASRIFKDEVRWKTLSSLVMLPISMRELAYRKVLGALAGTLPLLACFVLGFLLLPNGVNGFIRDVSENPEILWALALTVIQFVLFLHLTAFLSLVLKRGALPLAIAIHYVGGMIFIGFMSVFFIAIGSPGARSFMTAFICVVLTVILHWAVGFRLARAAAEE